MKEYYIKPEDCRKVCLGIINEFVDANGIGLPPNFYRIMFEDMNNGIFLKASVIIPIAVIFDVHSKDLYIGGLTNESLCPAAMKIKIEEFPEPLLDGVVRTDIPDLQYSITFFKEEGRVGTSHIGGKGSPIIDINMLLAYFAEVFKEIEKGW